MSTRSDDRTGCGVTFHTIKRANNAENTTRYVSYLRETSTAQGVVGNLKPYTGFTTECALKPYRVAGNRVVKDADVASQVFQKEICATGRHPAPVQLTVAARNQPTSCGEPRPQHGGRPQSRGSVRLITAHTSCSLTAAWPAST